MKIFQLTFILLFSFLCCLQTKPTFYMDPNNVNSTGDGSREDPFSSLQVIYSLEYQEAEFILLGESIVLDNVLSFPEGSKYFFRSGSNSTREYKIYFLNFAYFYCVYCDLGFERIEFAYSPKIYYVQFFLMLDHANVTLNEFIIQDLNNEFGFTVIQIVNTSLTITNSKFINLTNAIIKASDDSVVNVMGSKIIDYEFNQYFSLEGQGLFSVLGSEGNFINNTIERVNVSIGSVLSFSQSKLLINELIIQDSILASGVSLVSFEKAEFKVRNSIFRNIREEIVSRSEKEASKVTPGSGLIFNLVQSNSTLENLTFRNIQVQGSPLLRTDEMINEAPSQIMIRDIIIETCANYSLLVIGPQAIIQNVLLLNSTFYGQSIQITRSQNTFMPAIYVKESENVLIQNVTAKNISGPFCKFSNVKMIEISDCEFKNITTSENFLRENQRLVEISRNVSANSNNTMEIQAKIKNFNVYGYIYLEGIDDNTEVEFASLIYVSDSTAKLTIEGSRWVNVGMICVYANLVQLLKISNLTVTEDFDITSWKPPKRSIFRLLILSEMIFTDSYVFNTQNANIIKFSNLLTADSFIFKSTIISLSNISVMNNSFPPISSKDVLPTFFDFYSLLNLLVFKCQSSFFKNNQIAQSIISIQASNKTQIDLTNNTFQDNYSGGSSVIFNSYSMIKNLNILSLTHNTFTNNSCNSNGGLFSFVATKLQIIASNNTYNSISATGSGGVGYVYNTDLTYYEKDGIYTNVNSNRGGCWSFSILPSEDKTEQIKFTDTTFRKAQASQGGAIYVAQGDLGLTDCLFEENKAINSGGDIYVLKSASLKVENVIFIKSSSSVGAWIYAEDISGKMFDLKNITVKDIFSSESDAFLMGFNYGKLIISNSEFINISMPLFSSTSSYLTFQKLKLNDIICDTITQSFCVLGGTPNTLSIFDLQITNITSNLDLLNINSQEEVLIQNAQFENVKTNNNYDASDLPFIIKIVAAQKITVQLSKFLNIGFYAIKVQQSVLFLNNSTFSNSASQSRMLQQNGQTQESAVIFLVLESSNSTLANNRFLNNLTLSSSYKGGVRLIYDFPFNQKKALHITGDKGFHYISGSTFIGNRASNGGAIMVENGIYSIEISDCEFTNNQASGRGGCIFFKDDNLQSFLTIDKSRFISNQAQRGGCIFLGSQTTLIQNSNFTNNVANEGAAIASYVNDNKTNIIVRRSLFGENVANHFGPAIIAFGNRNFDITDTVFSNNKALLGSDATSQPNQLRMQIYEFDEVLLFLEKLTTQNLLSHASTKLVFDSLEPNSGISLKHKTGRFPNYILVFTLLDQLKQNTGIIDSSSSLTISIKSYSTLEGNIQPSLLGRASFNFEMNSGSIFVWKSFSIRANTDTSLTLSAQSLIKDIYKDEVKSLPSVEWKVQTVPCSEGEIYDENNIICSPCVEGTFSYEDPYKTDSCQQCQGPVTCKGSNVVLPQKGYWQLNRNVNNVIKCSVEEACLGGENNDGTDFSFSGFCGEGYQGIACARCRSGYAKFGNSQTCVDCKNDEGYFIKFTGFLVIQILGICITIKIYLSQISENETSKKFVIMKITILKIIIDFIHILNLSYGFTLNWPKAVDFLLYILTKIIPDSSDSLSIDCYMALTNNDENIFFKKLLLIVFQPIAYILCASGIWMLLYAVQRKKFWKENTFMSHLKLTSAIIIYFLQPYITKATFQLFRCNNYGSTSSPIYYLAGDTSIECWQSKHLAWTLGLGIFSLILWLVIPTLSLVSIMKRRTNLSSDMFTAIYDSLFIEYKPGLVYWEYIILVTKFLLIILISFLSGGYIKVNLAFVIIAIFYYLQVRIKPLCHPRGNIAQQISLLALVCLFYNALYFVPVDDSSNSLIDVLISINFIAATMFFGYCVYLVFKTITEKLKHVKIESQPEIKEINNQEDLKPIFNRNVKANPTNLRSSRGSNLDRFQSNDMTSQKKRHFSLKIPEDNQTSPIFTLNANSRFPLIFPRPNTKEKSREINNSFQREDFDDSRDSPEIQMSLYQKSPRENPLREEKNNELDDKVRNLENSYDIEDEDLKFSFDSQTNIDEKSPQDKHFMKLVIRSLQKKDKKFKSVQNIQIIHRAGDVEKEPKAESLHELQLDELNFRIEQTENDNKEIE